MKIPIIPQFTPSFLKFLDHHCVLINEIFKIILTFKPNIPNIFRYSNKYPPINANAKYPDKLYIACIIDVILNHRSWRSYTGIIDGKQLNKRFNMYNEHNVFKKLFIKTRNEYIFSDTSKLAYLSIDSSTINNKQCTSLKTRLPINKNRKAVKVSAIVDTIGMPLEILITDCGKHDSKLLIPTFNKFIKSNPFNRIIKKKQNKPTVLADSGYDSKSNREYIEGIKMKHIIAPNNRNTKNITKMRHMIKNDTNIYDKRIKVEHYYGIIKAYPKINNIMEKQINNYENMVLLVSSMLLINRIAIK
jgi:hypothetical protein